MNKTQRVQHIGGIATPFSSLSMAEKDFWDNVAWNTALAPRKAKPKRRGICRYMKPDEVIKRLAEVGITIDRRTLLRYVTWKLVATPERRSGGKGVGPIVDYPDHAVVEAAGAAELMQQLRWKKERVAAARRFFAELDQRGVDINDIDFSKPETVTKVCEDLDGVTPEGIQAVVIVADVKILWETYRYYLMRTLDQ